MGGWVGELMDGVGVGVYGWMSLLEMPCLVIKSIYSFYRRQKFCSQQPH